MSSVDRMDRKTRGYPCNKRNEFLIDATTWKNLKGIMLSERGYTYCYMLKQWLILHDVIQYITHLHDILQKLKL